MYPEILEDCVRVLKVLAAIAAVVIAVAFFALGRYTSPAPPSTTQQTPAME